MPPLPERVDPGDLITSELINEMLAMLREMDAEIDILAQSIGSGNMLVPSVFGRTLSSARAILTQPAINLRLGTVLDAAGHVVDPDLPDEQQRLVISQMPQAQTRVATGSRVALVLAGSVGNGSEPAPDPEIDGFDPVPAFVGEPVAIMGANFSEDLARNTVTFDGVSAGMPLEGNPTALTVTVPELPNPTAPGTTVPVTVVVSISGRAPASAEVDVAPRREDVPVISMVFDENGDEVPLGGAVDVDEVIQISGENFGDDLAAIQVSFGETDVDPESGGGTELTVSVPQLPGHSGANRFIEADMMVVVNPDDPETRRESNTFSLLVVFTP